MNGEIPDLFAGTRRGFLPILRKSRPAATSSEALFPGGFCLPAFPTGRNADVTTEIGGEQYGQRHYGS